MIEDGEWIAYIVTREDGFQELGRGSFEGAQHFMNTAPLTHALAGGVCHESILEDTIKRATKAL